MKTYQEACEDQIEEILDEFDFERVNKVMKASKWIWQDRDTPSIGDLRRAARELMRDIVAKSKNENEGTFSTGSGGLCVFANKGVDAKGHWVRLRLAFEVTDWETDDEKKISYKP